ncbi:MAG TPA: M14 family metallopeptidase [Phototrophicaceae bacterium]|nr:M14 family metallopeptidase [Phototrophicaceae bacterium]
MNTTAPVTSILTREIRGIPTHDRLTPFTLAPQQTRIPAATFTSPALLTPVSTISNETEFISIVPTPSPTTSPITPDLLSSSPTPSNFSGLFAFGQSVFGRELTALRLGDGDQMIMLVGGVHGGWEVNTSDLMNELITHFEQNPTGILPGISLMIIPVLNPDGASRGRVLEGRFNDHEVDLNRNWGCDWSSDAYFQSRKVSAGDAAFSEPETQALSTLILQVRPSVVLLYHSAADGIFTGHCNDDDAGSDAMAQILGDATGYSYGDSFTAYPVSGTAPDWITAQGIPSADVELATWRTTEFDRNLRGIMALQCWLTQSTPSVIRTAQCPS